MSYQINSSSGTLPLDKLPDECPFCHKSVTPNLISGYKQTNGVEVFMSCPDKKCNKSFIAYYDYSGPNMWKFSDRTTRGIIVGKVFNDSIKEISPNFEIIFNEAFAAEQEGLKEICGVGYRKALEFLIKDYAIIENEKAKEKILIMSLSSCINNYVKDERIKKVAKRAAWIGNDETHYVRKWEGKELQDLKKLIDLTVHWIEMEKLTESFEIDMPE